MKESKGGSKEWREGGREGGRERERERLHRSPARHFQKQLSAQMMKGTCMCACACQSLVLYGAHEAHASMSERPRPFALCPKVSPIRCRGCKYTWPGSNWRPSACEADVIVTRPQVQVTEMRAAGISQRRRTIGLDAPASTIPPGGASDRGRPRP